jgi:methionine-rich copper-binding protein CopC
MPFLRLALPRIALSLLGAALAVLVTATPAFAHTTLKSSDPANGTSLSTAPTQVTLTFEEAVTLPKTPITVTGPDGSSWTVGTATITGASVTAPVEATGPAGQYTLSYTVIADDGDAVKGAVRFTLATATTPTSTAVAASPEAQVVAPSVVAAAPTVAATPVESAGSSGTSLWVWVAVAVVVIGVLGGLAGFAATRSRRGSGRDVS